MTRHCARGIWFAGLLLLCCPAFSQAPADVPQDHWAYAAVQSLAEKGLIKGYPPSGNFFGRRTVTRYEMATIVQRVLARVDDLLEQKEDRGQTGKTGVTPEQLEEVRRLVGEFRVELTVIGTDLQKVRDQIGELRGQVDSARQTADRAAADAADAKQQVGEFRSEFSDLKEAVTLGRTEFENLNKAYNARKLSGYVQARFEAFDTGRTSLFTDTASGGTGQTPSTGGPAVGGPYYGFLVRRARLKFGGQLTTRTDWALQLDAASTGAVAVKDAFLNIADLPAPNFNGRFGLFAPSFGVELPASSSHRESPERALAFSDSTAPAAVFSTSTNAAGGVVTPGSVLPLFLNQDRDVGASFTWNSPTLLNPTSRITLGVFNGEGRGASGVRNLNNGMDVVGRYETTLAGGHVDLGVSGYYGYIAARGGAPTGGGGGTALTPVGFVNGKRVLGGVDVRWISPWGTNFRAEYIGGIFETTPDRAQFLKNNVAQGWYVTAKHPISSRLDFAVKYDEFLPVSRNGMTYQVNNAGTISTAPLSRMQLVRKTLQGGFLYYLDDATRLRFWYSKALTPYDPTAASGPRRTRLGLFTTEIQIAY